MTSQVYFMRPVGMAGPIKIGHSISPIKRLDLINPCSPFLLEIIATTPGSWALEYKLHRRFSEYHIHHEWFSPAEPLISTIDALRAGVLIDDAADLSIQSPRLPTKVQAVWDDKRRKYMGITARTRHATKRAGLSRRPDWVSDIEFKLSKDGGEPPTPAELARVEDFIANPLGETAPVPRCGPLDRRVPIQTHVRFASNPFADSSPAIQLIGGLALTSGPAGLFPFPARSLTSSDSNSRSAVTLHQFLASAPTREATQLVQSLQTVDS